MAMTQKMTPTPISVKGVIGSAGGAIARCSRRACATYTPSHTGNARTASAQTASIRTLTVLPGLGNGAGSTSLNPAYATAAAVTARTPASTIAAVPPYRRAASGRASAGVATTVAP